MRLTPLDIQHQQFSKKAFGYDATQVDQFLNLIQTEWEVLYQELHQKEEEIKQLEIILQEFRGRENALKDAIVYAQSMADGLKDQAQKEAQQIVIQASVQSDKMLRQAYERLARVMDDIRSAKTIRGEVHTKMKLLIESYAAMIEAKIKEDQGRNIEDVAVLPSHIHPSSA